MILLYLGITIGAFCIFNLYDPNQYYIGWLCHRAGWKRAGDSEKKIPPTTLEAIKSYFTPLMLCRHTSYPQSIFGSGDGVLVSGNKGFWNNNRIHASLIIMDGFHYRLGFIEYVKFVRWYKKNLNEFPLVSDDEYYAAAQDAERMVSGRGKLYCGDV